MQEIPENDAEPEQLAAWEPQVLHMNYKALGGAYKYLIMFYAAVGVMLVMLLIAWWNSERREFINLVGFMSVCAGMALLVALIQLFIFHRQLEITSEGCIRYSRGFYSKRCDIATIAGYRSVTITETYYKFYITMPGIEFLDSKGKRVLRVPLVFEPCEEFVAWVQESFKDWDWYHAGLRLAEKKKKPRPTTVKLPNKRPANTSRLK